MSVAKILEYQKIDMKLYKLERDYYKSDVVRAVAQYKQDAQNKNLMLNNLMAELKNCYQQISAINDKYEEAEALRNELLNVDFNTFDDAKDFEKYEKNLAKVEENLSEIAKEMAKLTKRINEISVENKNLNELVDKYLIAYKRASDLSDKAKSKVLEDGKPYAVQKKALEPDIEEKYLAKYKVLRSKKIMPAFVPYQDGNCLGCGVEIRIEVDRFLNNKYDCVECPHCGRMVFKAE